MEVLTTATQEVFLHPPELATIEYQVEAKLGRSMVILIESYIQKAMHANAIVFHGNYAQRDWVIAILFWITTGTTWNILGKIYMK